MSFNKKNNLENIIIYFFIISVLFFPVKFFNIYHIIITLPILFLSYIKNFKIEKNIYAFFILLFIIYWIISSSIRFFISGDNLRDALETFRFIPIFLFFYIRNVL